MLGRAFPVVAIHTRSCCQRPQFGVEQRTSFAPRGCDRSVFSCSRR